MSSLSPGIGHLATIIARILIIGASWSIDIIAASRLERQLINTLQQNYTKLERPVANSSTPVDVLLHITLQQIIDLVRRGDGLVKILNIAFFFFAHAG